MSEKRKGIPQGVRFNVLRRDNFTCRYCGRSSPTVELALDHVLPHSKGGGDTEANLVTACTSCNQGKSDKIDVTPPEAAEPTPSGFVGLFGHRLYGDDEPDPEWRGRIKNQFYITRAVGDGLYALQLFSFLIGNPTDIEVVTSAELSKPTYRFYATREDWHAAYERQPGIRA